MLELRYQLAMSDGVLAVMEPANTPAQIFSFLGFRRKIPQL